METINNGASTPANWGPEADKLNNNFTKAAAIGAGKGFKTVRLEKRELPYIDYEDNCVEASFKEVTRAGNGFLQLNINEPYARANSHAVYNVEHSGVINLYAYLHEDKIKEKPENSINNYFTDVQFPYMPNVQALIDMEETTNFRESPTLDLIHPEIVDTGLTAVGGYRYWICASNHPANNSLIEDEVIFVSNDFIEWKRIRAFTETFNSEIHATDLVLPPHDLVPTGTVTYDMFMPVPQPESGVFEVNEVNEEIDSYLKHDPVMVFDKDDGGIYILLVYNLKFVGDETPDLHNSSNQFLVCYRTFDGVNWEVVRADGSTLPLAQASDSRLIFTQTGGKDNYLRHRDHLPQRLGNSAVHHSDGFWYWFYGYNGDTIYKGTKFYNVDLANPVNYTYENKAVNNHPGHFSHGGSIYRWDGNGISKLNTSTYLWELYPINAMFRGFKGAEWQYKKSMHVTADGMAVWVVADRRESYRDFSYLPPYFNMVHANPITIGKADVAKLLDSAQNSNRGYYFSFEMQHQKDGSIDLYRVPFIYNNHGFYHFYRKLLFDSITVEKGDKLFIDVSAITYGDVSIGCFDLIIEFEE